MLNLLLLVSISRVLSYIDPCLPKGGPCKRYQDCPKDWACIDDSPDPIDPKNVHGICVGNKKIPGCEITDVCPVKKPRLNSYCGLEHAEKKCKYGKQILTCNNRRWKDSSPPNPNPWMCPKKRPNFNDYCHSSHEGLKCKYGKQLCCEKEYPEVVLQCTEGSWRGYHVDTTCMFEHECCNIRLSDKNIARCKQAICYQGIKCSCDSFPSVKRALCYP